MQNALNKVLAQYVRATQVSSNVALTLSRNGLPCPSLVPSVLCIGEYNTSISSEFIENE